MGNSKCQVVWAFVAEGAGSGVGGEEGGREKRAEERSRGKIPNSIAQDF